MSDSIASRGVTSIASWINWLLVLSLLLAIAFIIGNIGGPASVSFKVASVDLSINAGLAWAVFGLLSIAHLYLAVLLRRACRQLFCNEPSNTRSTWDELTHNGPFFFRGLIPRLVPSEGGLLVQMRWDDLTTWLVHATAILAFVAMVPFETPTLVGIAPALPR